MYPGSELLAPARTRPAGRGRAARRRWIAVLIVLALGLGAAWYADRGDAAPDLGRLPWPSAGTAALSVEGRAASGAPGADEAVPIASVAKVMTAYVVLHDHPMRVGDTGPYLTVTKAEAAAYSGQLAAGESLVPVDAEEQIDERQALEALLLPSADNMAWILARWDAGGQDAFLAKMNQTARGLGMRRTTYTDASGLDAGTVSSAHDQLLLGVAALKIPALAQIVAESTATVPVAGVVHNYNTLLGKNGVIGLKTGSTSAAGGCLLFAARTEVDGRVVTIIGVVLGQPGKGRKMLTAALQAAERLVTASTAALLADH
jgi:D-alanyl-D-alanine carboxypeptidase (penicillin-binding protein 5/6)